VRFPGFIGPSYTLSSVNADCQRCVNLYPEVNEVGTGKEREVATLVGTPGLRLLASLGAGPLRGTYTTSTGVLYVVSGSTLYSLTEAWAVTTVGTLATSAGFVSLADNGIQLFLVDGSNGYYVTLSTQAFTHVTDPNFLGADQVTFQDGYFIFNKPNSQQFYISGLNDVSFDPTDISTAEGSPDSLVGLVSDQRNLYLFGTYSTEVFYDSGATFPFERIQGAFIAVGCMAAFSIAQLEQSVYWLGQDRNGRGIVYRVQGYQAQRVSTRALEIVISKFSSSSLSSARAWSYTQNGHSFYAITFPGAESTWVYDVSTSLWHERASLNLGDLARHRADCHAFAYGTNVVGDYANGNLYALDGETYSDNGSPIPRIRSAPHMSQSLNRVFHSSFQLDMETGVGTDGSGQGSAPVAVLQWSDDGGHTWSNEKEASIGAIGSTKARAIFRRLGASRDRVYRVKITDPVKVVLLGAEIGVEAGVS
jgi:hypothetical protein